MNQTISRLIRSYSKGFDPELVFQNMSKILNKYVNSPHLAMEFKCGISEADIVAFSYIKIKQMGKSQVGLLKKFEDLIEFAVKSPTLSNHLLGISSDSNHQLTFYEYYLLDIEKNIHCYSSSYLAMLRELVVNSNIPDVSRRVATSYLAFKLSGCKSERIDFIDAESIRNTLISVLRNEIGKLNAFQINNIIDSSVHLEISLSDFKFDNDLSMGDVMKLYFEQNEFEKYIAACQHQEAIKVISKNHDLIDYSFNTDMYYDF